MDVLDDRKVIIRKPQNCWGCRREFPKGTELVYVKLVDADGFSSCYWCPVCVAVMDRMPAWEKEDGFAYGELIDEFENWHDVAKQFDEAREQGQSHD